MSSSSLLDPKRKASLKKRARCEKRKKGKSNSYDDGFDAPPQEDEQDDFDLSDPSLKVKWKQKRRKLDITSALKKYTFCTVKQDGIKLIPDLPSLPLTSYLDWSGKPYILYYNPNVDVTFRDRMVSIEFSQGLPSATSPEKNILLGTLYLEIVDIKSNVEEQGRAQLTSSFPRTDDLMGGSITITVKRLYTTEEDIIAQKQRLAREISKLSEWIKREKRKRKMKKATI